MNAQEPIDTAITLFAGDKGLMAIGCRPDPTPGLKPGESLYPHDPRAERLHLNRRLASGRFGDPATDQIFKLE